MSEPLHVIFGTGPAGIWTARALFAMGQRVRAVNRSGKRPDLMPGEVDVVASDASNLQQAIDAARDADVVYQALNPPYDRWAELFPPLQRSALEAARAAGARYVSIDNLYGYGPVSGTLTEEATPAPNTKKGRLRLAMTREVLEAHARGDVRAAILQSSDYYGPGVRLSQFGERTFTPMLAGKPADVAGRADVPHSYAYIEDVGHAAAALGTRDEAPGRVWFAPHAPALTQQAMVDEACRQLGIAPRVRVIGPLMMRLAGLFVPAARESVEMLYQYMEPFVVSSAAIESAFGLAPTPITEGLKRTIEWWKGKK
ncbi:MAG: NAD-dependent epimerase/dehydratase family protein [Vicinamibacterales bacterium]